MKKIAIRFLAVALSIALTVGVAGVGFAVDDYPGAGYAASLVNNAGNDRIEVGDTAVVSTEDELMSAIAGVAGTGKSLEIQVEGIIPVEGILVNGCSITLTGGGTLERKSDSGNLITVSAFGDETSSLTLKDITVDGKEIYVLENVAPNPAMIAVNGNASLTIEAGAVLENSRCGSAVRAGGGAAITMTGGTIRNNVAAQGAGICIDAGTAVISGGSITGNTAAPAGKGGGIFVGGTNSTFCMDGGTISGNTAISRSASDDAPYIDGQGGGVFIDSNAAFTMTNGEIKDNFSDDDTLTGIGVYSLGTFVLSGGEISGNAPRETASGARGLGHMGAGVYAENDFTMTGGSITGNKGLGGGGVIYIGSCLGGRFLLSGTADISGNMFSMLDIPADIFISEAIIQVTGALSTSKSIVIYPDEAIDSGRGPVAQGAETYTLTQTDASKFLTLGEGWGYTFEFANAVLQYVGETSAGVLPYPYASVPSGTYAELISLELCSDTEDAELYYQVVDGFPGKQDEPEDFCTEDRKYTSGSKIEISNASPYATLSFCAKNGDVYSKVRSNHYSFPRMVKMTISPHLSSSMQGGSRSFYAWAFCEGGRVQMDPAWSVEGATSAKTGINQHSLLTVGADETASALTVKLTDRISGMFATASVMVKVDACVTASQPNGVYGQPLPELAKAVEHAGTNGEWWVLYSGTEGTEYETSEVKPTAAGDYIVIADYSSDEYKGYAVAPFVIEKAPLTAKPTDKSIYVGAALPTEFSLAYTGLVNGDTASVLTVTGTPEYALKNGDNVLENSNTAGTYAIQWSNKDAVTIEAANYIVTEGDGVLTISTQSSGGGNGGGSVTPPKPTENPDGSATTTEIDKKTGTVRATTKYPDGKTEIVETKKDGTITAKVETADGTKTEQIKKPDGSMSAKEERKDGTKLESKTTSDGTTTASVSVPDHVEKVTVTVPTPAKPKAGEVAVIVKADGTREVVKTSVCTEEGMRVTLPAGATLEIADNTKQFADVSEENWAAEAVQFATSRELFSGTGADRFSPSENMSRAMLFTVLARLDGQDTAGGANWYDEATNWAKTEGLSDGTASERDITREQMAVMLYRYVGSPDAEAAALDGFSDVGAVSPWAKNAMRWATESGLVGGKSGNTIAPTAIASRAEVAAILQRFVSGM